MAILYFIFTLFTLGCSCQILKFEDLSLHQWLDPRSQNKAVDDDDDADNETGSIFTTDLLKVATCVVAENPSELLAKLPSDLQVFTILESGNGESDIVLHSSDFQRFGDLISLEIQGQEIGNITKIVNPIKRGGIILSADTLLPLGMTLLYLNLERVTLTNSSLTNKNKANLVVKPAISSTEDSIFPKNNSINLAGHRLIFLSQQVNDSKDDMEILPYDIFKQEVEGRTDIGGLFTGLSVLTHLRVYDCELKDISWHMFDGLENLIYLSLEKNDLKVIPEFCFYGTPNLKKLSLAENQLLTLTSVDLAGLLTLEHLDLSGNNLTFLSELTFPPFPNLQVANFERNPLDSIFPSTFEIMNTTLQLYIGGEGSKLKLQKNSFLGLRELEVLHLFNVEMENLERFFLQGMPALKQLKLRGNISRIEFDAFIDLIQLIDLDLRHCHLRQISMDAFYGLENVKRIDLSYNDLDYIPPGLFAIQQQKSLKEIILSKNRITTLPHDFFKSLRNINRQPQIQNLRLDGNPWDCSCAMENWNPHVVNKTRETTPRCFTPKSVQNWGVFHALRKGGLQCKRFKRRQIRKLSKVPNMEENNIS
ncbi:insulin-like growth factor-binding protein complex acid labile subunit isoform X2 [Leptopilina boulardi]|uniref:insulin-like growth factor-binding protein complex acid labile subunit isoform X2 n=1 Tax=Leptopilina boulardi TaxID=63433 RepID=UPI0021F63630|nr:insulin-like growth factor-binding protein complex acid labile subunit isoform X2 [Leptopilina boulardi]